MYDFLSSMTAFLSIYITICSRFDFPVANILSIENITTYLIAHLAIGLLSVFYSMPVITKGIKNLLRFKADSDSMTAVTAITCLISVISAFFQPEMAREEIIHIYMPTNISIVVEINYTFCTFAFFLGFF